MNYTRYFVVNLVVEGFHSWLLDWLLEKTQVARLSYVILEVKEEVFDDNFCYTYTGFCFEGIHIKKSLNAKSVDRLITSTSRSHINISRCVPKSLTDEEILSMVKDDILHNLIPISIKSKLRMIKNVS